MGNGKFVFVVMTYFITMYLLPPLDMGYVLFGLLVCFSTVAMIYHYEETQIKYDYFHKKIDRITRNRKI